MAAQPARTVSTSAAPNWQSGRAGAGSGPYAPASLSAKPAKGILKNKSEQSPLATVTMHGEIMDQQGHILQPDVRSGVAWDEANITETEGSKDATMKVTEPKTPYIYYDEEGDTVEGFRDVGTVSPSVLSDALQRAVMSDSLTPKTMQVDGSAAQPTSQGGVSSADEEEDEDEIMSDAERQKRERFRKLRAQHYHMAGAGLHQGPYEGPGSSHSSRKSGDDSDSSSDEE